MIEFHSCLCVFKMCSCYGLNWRHYFVFRLSILFISVGWSRHANIFCSFSTFREQSNWQQLYWIANNRNTADRNWTRERTEQRSKACALDHYHVKCMGPFSPMQHYRPFSLIQLQKGRIVRNNEGEKKKAGSLLLMYVYTCSKMKPLCVSRQIFGWG